MSLLSQIKAPGDVRSLPTDQLPLLAKEIRDRIIETTSRNGGHVGPNLGVVELTIALHRIFDCPNDRFTFDVSHQGYVHKLLTGRNDERFDKIRKSDGLSGFLNREESEHDHYGAGHAGTALSAALGMATARDKMGGKEHVVAVCGDAAFTCGITFEALNNIAAATKRMIVILNDNEWSIAKNVGAISHYFNELITNPVYNRFFEDVDSFLKRVPGGQRLINFSNKAKRETKDFLLASSMFEHFGLRYVGPIDGHDFDALHRYLEFCRASDLPVLLHVLTKKGKGYEVAIDQPEKFHGTSAFEIETGKSAPRKPGTPDNYQDVFGKTLTQLAGADKRIVGITGAMPSGTGLSHLAAALPDQFIDVGIAEEHAVLLAAGMATRGTKPVVAIYSTFLQRGYDCIIHDVCLQNLDVTFCMDRAGLSPNDGATHHGMFDIAYLRTVPRTVVMQPKDEDELADMIHTAIEHPGPAFVRYPRGVSEGVERKEQPQLLPIGKAEVLRTGSGISIWALGPFVHTALDLAETLAADGISVQVVNARFAKPLDEDLLKASAQSNRLIVTMEDHVRTGGFGSAILEACNEHNLATPVLRLGWPDRFVDHGSSINSLRAEHGLDDETLLNRVRERWERITAGEKVAASAPQT